MLFISLFPVFAANFGKLIFNLQRYYKKCTYARKHDEFLQKKNSFFIIRRNMPIMLVSNRRIETDDKCASIEEINSRDCLAQNFSFFSEGTHPVGEGACRKKHIRELEYGQHFANVLSGECAKRRRRPKVLQKNHPVGHSLNTKHSTLNYQSRVLDGFILYLH